ncbi:MAG TPA: energy transducer TonB [Gemmatimonadaceae bacterium]|nr:energy transducer TonB [Gemmatimonadaceae bacterium]
MLSVLPESRRERRRSRASVLLSAAAHAAIIGAGTYASAKEPTRPAASVVADTVIYFPAPPDPAPAEPTRRGGAREARGGERAAPTPPRLSPCECVPPELPPIEATLAGPGEVTVDPSELSSPRDGVRGGQGGPGDGAPLASEYADTPAEPLRDNPRPRYPDLLRAAGVGGSVVVRFVVDSTGRVERGSLVVESSDHELLEREVRAVLPRLRFRPAMVNGRRVRVLAQQRFTFGIER